MFEFFVTFVNIGFAKEERADIPTQFSRPEAPPSVHVLAVQRSQVVALSRDWYCPGGQGRQGTKPSWEK